MRQVLHFNFFDYQQKQSIILLKVPELIDPKYKLP